MSNVEVIQGRPEEPPPVYDKRLISNLINRPALITEHLQLIIYTETAGRLTSVDHLIDSSLY